MGLRGDLGCGCLFEQCWILRGFKDSWSLKHWGIVGRRIQELIAGAESVVLTTPSNGDLGWEVVGYLAVTKYSDKGSLEMKRF